MSPFCSVAAGGSHSLHTKRGAQVVNGTNAEGPVGTAVWAPTCWSLAASNNHTPERLGPVSDAVTAAVSRQRLHTEYPSPFFLGPAHLRNKQVFKNKFLCFWDPQNILSKNPHSAEHYVYTP